jgi:hypothetical protein
MKKYEMFRITLTVFLLMFTPAIYAQDTNNTDADENKFPLVYIETYPQTPTAGVPWILTLLIDHGVPDEVIVIAPPLSPSLSMDRFIKTPRMTNSRLQTVVEYRFILNTPGRYTLESFTVITPHGTAETEPYILEIQGAVTEQRASSPRIFWEGSPGQMAAGERAVLSLRITGWNSGRLPQEFFMPEVPRGAILEALPLTAEERSRGIAIKLNLIPLGDFRLPARILRYENLMFEIPALYIRVTNAASRVTERETPEQNTAYIARDSGNISDNTHAPFPDFNLASPDNLFFGKIILDKLWYAQCENIYHKTRDLWDRGLYSQALAELRQNEREHPAGVLLRPIRREAEEKLLFFNMENENRWRRKLLLSLSFLVFFLVIIVPLVCFAFIRKPFQKGAALFPLLCAFVFAIVVFAYIYIFLDSRNVFSGNENRFGVTNETPVRRTADFDGENLFRFREGQPVVIMLNSGTWVFVRTNDSAGSSGWIPAEEVIFY